MSSLKVQIGGLQQQLMAAADRAIDLTLKSSGQYLPALLTSAGLKERKDDA